MSADNLKQDFKEIHKSLDSMDRVFSDIRERLDLLIEIYEHKLGL